MSTVGKVIITIVIIIAVVLGGWWLITSMSNNTNIDSSDQSNDQSQESESSEGQQSATTITYNGTKFTPETLTVKAGEEIQIVNGSENVMFFASDEHPTHQDNSELNAGDIQPAKTATITISTPGTWGYHDHYNAAAGGKIIVE